MEYFFDADKPHWAPWRRDQRVDKAWQRFKPERRSLAGRAPPLYFASLCGFYDLAEHLGGKHPEHVNWSGGWLVTPLVATLFGKHFQIAELLHREDADVDILSDLDSKGTTLLNAACQDGFLDIAEWLLNHGANVNIKGYGRWTSLHDAVFNGRLQVLQMLIGHNADIDIRNAFGVSPLHMASNPQDERDQVAIMRALLDHGANPNARDNHDATPLHHSSWWHGSDSPSRHGSVEGTRLLLEHGAVIDAEDNEGRTPLQLALEHGRDDIVACLKEHGATR
jgi:ankyrin repeat protein